MSLSDMVRKRLLADVEHQCETEFKPVRVQEIALAADDETTCRNKHTSGWRLRDLICVHPVDSRCDIIFPARAVAHFKRGRLIEAERRDWKSRRILKDTDSCTMQLRMHK